VKTHEGFCRFVEGGGSDLNQRGFRTISLGKRN